jgi:hypothetical protein
MPASQACFHHPAIFGCSVTGCSRAFKSEPTLKRHQTNVHVVPQALCPRPRHNPNAQPAQATQMEPPILEENDTEHLGPSQYESADGFYVERHPILDGKCDP